MTRWGLYDTEDNCWMGDNETYTGPKLFEEYGLARIAAQVMDVQLRQQPGRTKATEFIEQPLRLRDKVNTKMDSLEALKGIESGKLI